jgi:glycosyltransferase involved in cell wall biosynthesis
MMVIHNGIDTSWFYPDPEGRELARKEWGVSDKEKLIGLVARLDPIKDHLTFIKASALLSDRSNIRFVCVGDGPDDYKNELKAFSEEKGVGDLFIWKDSCRDMPAAYNALDMLVSSSYGEGFPNVLGEAMACGVPCVVTDVGDSARIVGDMGEVVPPKDPKALAQGIRTILERLDDNHKKLSKSLRERIILNFRRQILIEKTSEALRGLL